MPPASAFKDRVRYRRITSGTACAFCRMLAGRGAVYSENTGRFQAHDHCACTAEPDFTTKRARRNYDNPVVWDALERGGWEEQFATQKAFTSWWNKEFGTQATAHIDEELGAVHSYQGAGYDTINSVARGRVLDRFPDPDQASAVITRSTQTMRHLDNAIAAVTPLSQPTVVYRGFALETSVIADLQPGTVFTDAGFMSTSLDRKTALQFAYDSRAKDKAVALLRITIPQGERALQPDMWVGRSAIGNEKELILARGRVLRIVSRTERPDRFSRIMTELEAFLE